MVAIALARLSFCTWTIDGAGIVAILTVPERAAAVLDVLRRGRIVGRVDDSRGWFRANPQALRGAQKAGSALSQYRQLDRPRRGGGQGECDRLRKRAFARFAGAPIDQR
jgi:hypothetical protein